MIYSTRPIEVVGCNPKQTFAAYRTPLPSEVTQSEVAYSPVYPVF